MPIILFFICCHAYEESSPLLEIQDFSQPPPSDPLVEVLRVERTSEEVNIYLSGLPEEQRFLTVFYLGEKQYSKYSLAEISMIGSRIEEQYRFDFFDGVSHGVNWSNFSSTEQAIAQIEQEIPTQYHERFFNGLIMSSVESANGDVEKINQIISSYEGRYPISFIQDGVRVGIQRSLGHQAKKALLIVKELPEKYKRPTLEELGWRVGTDFFEQFMREGWGDTLNANERCVYLHGIARGFTQYHFDKGVLQPAIEKSKRLGIQCESHVWRGFGRALAIHQASRSKIPAYTIQLTKEQRHWVLEGYEHHKVFPLWRLGPL